MHTTRTTRRFAHLFLACVPSFFLPALDAAETAAPVVVDLSESTGIRETISVNGTVTALRRAELSTAVTGQVTGLSVETGDKVAQGEALLQLDLELAQLSLQRARAAVARARAELDDAQRRVDEARELSSEQGIAASEVRDREAARDMAAASLEEAKATAAEQNALLERHVVRAPFAGVINARHVELGEWIAPGDAVFDLVSTKQLRFDFRVPQEIYAKIGATMALTLFVNSSAAEGFTGRVETVVPVSDEQARSFLLRAVADDIPEAVTPGMSARAVLELDAGRTGVVVVRDALLRHPDSRTTVWVVETEKGNPVAHERNVDVGLVFGNRVEITKGLVAGEHVVVRGNEALQEGQVVRVMRNEAG